MIKPGELVKVKEFDRKQQKVVYNGKVGIFHCWSVDSEEYETGSGNFPVAIVEYANGTIENIYSEMIERHES